MVSLVVETENGLEYPPDIPQKRFSSKHSIFKSRDITYKIVNIGLLLLVSFVYATSPKLETIHVLASFSITFFVFLEVFFMRTMSLIEEYHHLTSRYENSLPMLLHAAYKFNTMSKITVMLSFSSYSVYYIQTEKGIIENNTISLFCILAAVYLFKEIIKLSECPMNIARQLDDSLGLDYGSGMAHSYFEGYLKVILPTFGDERKGLIEMIQNYEDIHGVTFGDHKIYILIPLSGFCPPKIVTQSKIAEEAGKLESRVIPVAGTQQRVYHASVYKLHKNEKDRPIYVCAEYATPLKTLNEAMNRNSPEAALYKRHYPELVTNFYETLRKLVKKRYHYCELIYYKDTDAEGIVLKNLDVGRLILDRMES